MANLALEPIIVMSERRLLSSLAPQEERRH